MKTLNICIPLNRMCISAVISTLEIELDNIDDQSVTTVAAIAPAPAADDTVVDITVNKPALATDVELDSEGLPWDHRIHSSKKTKIKSSGLWKVARGKDPALVKSVMTELRATMAASGGAAALAPAPAAPAVPAPSPAAPPPPALAAPSPAPEPIYIVDGSGEFTRAQLTGWTDEQIASLPVKPVAVGAGITFPELMAKITAAITAGTLTDEQVLAAVNNIGVDSLPLIAARPDLWPSVDSALFG